MKIVTATDAEIAEFITRYSSWSVVNFKLHREYIFNNFIAAFGFMTESALIAESTNHHPEWFNVYKKVIVELTTHEVDGISKRDFELAQSMEEIFSARTPGYIKLRNH